MLILIYLLHFPLLINCWVLTRQGALFGHHVYLKLQSYLINLQLQWLTLAQCQTSIGLVSLTCLCPFWSTWALGREGVVAKLTPEPPHPSGKTLPYYWACVANFCMTYSRRFERNINVSSPSTCETQYCGSLRDREVACSASNRQGSNFESCVWRTVSSHSSHHPQEVLLVRFSLYVHKGGLKPDSFLFAWHILLYLSP